MPGRFKRRTPVPGQAVKYEGLIKIGGQFLPPLEALFLREYVKDFKAGAAAGRAGISNPAWYASVTLQRPRVLLALHTLIKDRCERIDVDVDEVAKYWYTLATADARELAGMTRGCCRYCYGIENLYQYTVREQQQAMLAHRVKYKDEPDPPLFDEKGGDGYDFTQEPNRECPECHGEGIWRSRTIDLNNLSPGAAMLFEGFKVDRSGNIVEIKLRSRDSAMRNFSELMGFIRPRRGLWDFDFDKLDDAQMDAIISEARSRGLLRDDELPMRDVTPSTGQIESRPTEDEDERVS